jgi:hypothetical protein
VVGRLVANEQASVMSAATEAFNQSQSGDARAAVGVEGRKMQDVHAGSL